MSVDEAGGQLGLGVEGSEQFVQKHQGEDLHHCMQDGPAALLSPCPNMCWPSWAEVLIGLMSSFNFADE